MKNVIFALAVLVLFASCTKTNEMPSAASQTTNPELLALSYDITSQTIEAGPAGNASDTLVGEVTGPAIFTDTPIHITVELNYVTQGNKTVIQVAVATILPNTIRGKFTILMQKQGAINSLKVVSVSK